MKTRIKTLVATALVAVMLSPITAYASIGQGTIQSSVSFRERPSTSSTVMRYLKSGERVTILEKINSYWYKVSDASGKTGYISSNQKYIQASITPVSSAPAAPAPAGGAGVGNVVASVSFRDKPGTSSAVMRYLKQGEQVVILETVNAYWFKIQDKYGKTGYVSSSGKYISAKLAPAAAAPAPSGSQGTEGQAQRDKAEAVIAAGMKYLGTPYEYGSDRNSTATFDCSDFTRRVFIDGLNITLPADSRKQAAYVKEKGAVRTGIGSLKRGDLVFFTDYKGSSASNYSGIDKSTARISHVAVYLGDGQLLHTYSNTSGGVRTSKMGGNHWEYRFLFGGSAF
ncbi:SH3 domain-containing protein [Paenibacillus tarimensis]